ncbi:MAG: hypothetical protein ACI82A_004098 [Candidatus Azotimanducaceae bacterium]|jgi:hypothetical protein
MSQKLQLRVVNISTIVACVFILTHQLDLFVHKDSEKLLQRRIILNQGYDFTGRKRVRAGHLAQQIVGYCPGLETQNRLEEKKN